MSSGDCPSRPDIYFFRSIKIGKYEDLHQVELEIRRVLKCGSQRLPVCMTTESYARFRCNVLQRMDDRKKKRDEESTNNMTTTTANTLQLTQSLVVKLQDDPCSETMQVHLGWEGTAMSNPQQREAEEQGRESDDDDGEEMDRATAKKKPRKMIRKKKKPLESFRKK